ncbi:MAG TPA: SRPBCC family protein [Steroidobacteraceae bacterium]|nr:SRPBCC family protein [Steroidobacteraceae bacterium]
MNRPHPRVVTVAPVRKSVRVNADAARAFEVFTAGFARWWPRSHHIGAAPLKEACIEPRVGGRWYERGEDGSECEWGRVLAWEPSVRVLLGWQINNQFKYDPTTMSEVEIRFIAESAGVTRVELEHRHIERLGGDAPELRQKVDAPNGWGLILQTYAAAVAAKE